MPFCRFLRFRRFARYDEWDIGCHHPQESSVRQVGCPPVAAFSPGDFALLQKTHDHLERGKVQCPTLAGLRTLPELTASWNTGPGPVSFLCAFAASREMLYSAHSAPLRENIDNIRDHPRHPFYPRSIFASAITICPSARPPSLVGSCECVSTSKSSSCKR